jgi:hypothetical protein
MLHFLKNYLSALIGSVYLLELPQSIAEPFLWNYEIELHPRMYKIGNIQGNEADETSPVQPCSRASFVVLLLSRLPSDCFPLARLLRHPLMENVSQLACANK